MLRYGWNRYISAVHMWPISFQRISMKPAYCIARAQKSYIMAPFELASQDEWGSS
jgi:hypothetical protein